MISGEKVKHGGLWTVLFSLVSLAWVFPIVLVIINSFKQKAYISRDAFSIPTGKAFVGLENYTRGIETTNFFASFGWTLLITVGSVILILVCTSMCAWWIVRVNNWAAKLLYTLFLFNMIVPFQMVMFTLSKLADMLKLNLRGACALCTWDSAQAWPCSSSPVWSRAFRSRWKSPQ